MAEAVPTPVAITIAVALDCGFAVAFAMYEFGIVFLAALALTTAAARAARSAKRKRA